MRRLPTWLATAFAIALLAPLAAGLAALPDAPRVLDMRADAPSSTSRAMAETDAGDYTLRFRCPERADAPPEIPTSGSDPVCPSFIYDREDIFGQPVMLVDPRNPDYMAFSAMHGGRGIHGPNSEPPSERSRDDLVHQPHTTFRSVNGGTSWEDMPYHAPDSLQRTGEGGQRTRDIFGEDNAAVQDASGRVYLAALYAYRDTGGTPLGAASDFRYAVGLWKAKGPEVPVDYHVNSKVIDTSADGLSRADSLHMVYVPGSDTVAVMWRETAPEGAVGAGGNDTGVAFHWTRPQDGALWHEARVDVGPCDSISNPLAVDEFLYVACRVKGEDARVYAVDTTSWTASVGGTSQVAGDHLRLVPRVHGYMVLIGSGLDGSGRPIVDVSYGERGARWSSPDDLSADVAPPADFPLVEARVTAAGYSPRSGNLHVVWMERYDLASGGPTDGSTPEFAKYVASMQAEGNFLARVDLGMGTISRVGFSPTVTGIGSGAFNDLHDSIVIWSGAPYGVEDREFVAFGDYGYVRFAEVVEENFVPPIVPLGTTVPPVPFATPGSIPVLVGVPAALLTGAAVARTIAARRAHAVEVGSE